MKKKASKKGYIVFGVYSEVEINKSVCDQLDGIKLVYLGKVASLEEAENAIANDVHKRTVTDDVEFLKGVAKRSRVVMEGGIIEYDIYLGQFIQCGWKTTYMAVKI